jgi:hypothetical protein
MAIEGLQGIFRPVVIRREKDAEDSRRQRKGQPPREEQEETADPEKGKVDIKV